MCREGLEEEEEVQKGEAGGEDFPARLLYLFQLMEVSKKEDVMW